MKSFGETRCMIPQKPENPNKIGNRKKYKEIFRIKMPDWLQEFRENLVHESTSEGRREDLMQRSAHTSSSSHEPPMEPRAYVDCRSQKLVKKVNRGTITDMPW